MQRSQWRAWATAGALLASVTFSPAVASTSAATVTEYTLPAKYVGSLAQGPDGIVWYGMRLGDKLGGDGRLGRLRPSGPIDELNVPDYLSYYGPLAIGPEGNAWLASFEPRFGQLQPSGRWATVKIRDVEFVEGSTSARSGGIWFTKRGRSGIDTVGRIYPNGRVTERPLPHRESGPGSIVEAKNGDVWFTEYFSSRIGRLTPSGRLIEYKVGRYAELSGITADSKGQVWFTTSSREVWWINTSGEKKRRKLPKDVTAFNIVAAADGTLWFGIGKPGRIGRMTPTGKFNEVKLHDPGMYLEDLMAGREGNIFYTASSEGPCHGGGGSCLAREPLRPATVGRISP